MSNSVEFFQPQNSHLAVGAICPSVYLDGQLCDFLDVQSITLAAQPQFNQAVLSFLPRSIQDDVECGQKIEIKTVYDSGIGAACPDELTIFSGFITQIDIAESTTIIAKDYSDKLKYRTVYGQHIFSSDGQTVFIEAADTVFNPSGQPNMAEGQTLFAAELNNAQPFTCADAIYYLLQNYIAPGELKYPTLEQLQTLTQNCAIRDADVTGLNLLEALAKCCRQAGLQFKFSVDSQAVVFYRYGKGRTVELNCQSQGQKLDISKTNIAQVVRKKMPAVTNRYIVQGDYKVFEATFNLVKGWNPQIETTNYDLYSPNSNENFNDVRDVYRKWVLNETGDYTASPYNQGSAFDFSQIFQTDKYIRKARRFYPAISCSDDGGSVGYYLEMSYTNGSKWWPYMSSFKVLLDQCGIWLSVEQLDSDMWFAILKGVLKVRITASVVSDQRISYTAADGPVGSMMPVADKIITLPKRFKYQKVAPQSAFFGSKANEIDDTAHIVAYANSLCEINKTGSETLQIKTMTAVPYFSPGDRIVSSPDSRDLLGVMYDTQNICCVEKVYVDFVGQQTTLTAVKKQK